MKKNLRIAIADRSLLAHNVYRMLLKPAGYSLFLYKTLREMKENLDFKWGCPVVLINSNTFGNHFDRHFEWLKKESGLQKTNKIFLCEPNEKKTQSVLKGLTKSHFLMRPFFPDALATLLKDVL